MVALGAVAEPLVVITLLTFGTWINRDFDYPRQSHRILRRPWWGDVETGKFVRAAEEVEDNSRSTSPSLLALQEPKWRKRRLRIWGFTTEVTTPNTRRFQGYLLSRILNKFPFLVECWYWALIYWVYQLGRAATAVWIAEGTVFAAQKHALQVIAAEERLHIFWELGIQKLCMRNKFFMIWINRTYSFIHIPGSIAFLVWLFYYTTTRNRAIEAQVDRNSGQSTGPYVGPGLYKSRRRTMAFCNLLAFVVFTLWPCMPPRLLSANTSEDEIGILARSYGFIDTVHGSQGESSIWTDNRFTNKYAAMPSLHFGYSLLVGLTVATIPVNPSHPPMGSFKPPTSVRWHIKHTREITIPSTPRLLCLIVGTVYPSVILLAITATANHFILDAVAGACICALAWYGNDVMLNLLVVEDWFLCIVRIHKPEEMVLEVEDKRVITKVVLKE